MFFTDCYNSFIIEVYLKDKKVITIMGALEYF